MLKFRGGNRPPEPWSVLLTSEELTRALDRLMSLGWEDYEGQVVEFLDDDSCEEFGDKPAWEMMQNQILTELEANA